MKLVYLQNSSYSVYTRCLIHKQQNFLSEAIVCELGFCLTVASVTSRNTPKYNYDDHAQQQCTHTPPFNVFPRLGPYSVIKQQKTVLSIVYGSSSSVAVCARRCLHTSEIFSVSSAGPDHLSFAPICHGDNCILTAIKLKSMADDMQVKA